MKKTSLFTAAVVFLFLLAGTKVHSSPQQEDIKIICSSGIEDITQVWVTDYSSMDKKAQLQVQVIEKSDLQMPEEGFSDKNIYLVTDDCLSGLDGQYTWNMPLCRQVYVLIYNNKNPLHEQIQSTGLSPADISLMLEDPENNGWEISADNDTYLPAQYYRLYDLPQKTNVAKFFNTDKIGDGGIKLGSRNELLTAVRQNTNALACCRLADIIDPQTNGLPGDIALMPIDRNANNKLDYFENIYGNLHDFNRAVWLGKYPRVMVQDVYAIAKEKPGSEEQVFFLKWVLTEGQKSLQDLGFNGLTASERHAEMDELMSTQEADLVSGEANAGYRIFLYILAGFIVFGIIINYLYRRIRTKRNEREPNPARTIGALTEENIQIPAGIYYDKSHTWAFMEQDGKVKIGIDDFLQRLAGPFTRIKIKETGQKVKKNEDLITLMQDGKHIILKSPVSGIVKVQNKHVLANPSLINSSPYDKGWILMIEPANWMREIQFMKMSENYRQWIQKELKRFKDFLAIHFNARMNNNNAVAFQDGGELRDQILQELGPETWEDFQKNFIDTSE